MIKTYELKLMSGEVFIIESDIKNIDNLLDLIGDLNFEYCEQL